MRPVLYSHPFSSYCQKVLIALYENGTDFEARKLGEDEGVYEELVAAWTGRIHWNIASRRSRAIENDFWRGHRLRAQSMRRAPTGETFRLAKRIAIRT